MVVNGVKQRRSESKMFSLLSFLRKGVSLGYVGSIQILEDLKDSKHMKTDDTDILNNNAIRTPTQFDQHEPSTLEEKGPYP